MVFLLKETEPEGGDEAEVRQKREALKTEGKSLLTLTVAKGRDGVLRDSFGLDFWYRQARMEERPD
jgi:hypothetical protein